jgi:hypothetical protein
MKASHLQIQAEAVPVNMPHHPALPEGTKFTIQGVKLLPNGRFLTDCKPGEETVLVNSLKPSIYKLIAPGNDAKPR